MRNKLTKYESLNFIFIKRKRYLLLTMTAVLAGLNMLFTSCEDKKDNELTNGNTVTDIDGNTYRTVVIGNQVWMAENLKTTTYNDGMPITLEEDNTTWSNLTTGAYCWYDNDEATYNDIYGALYNWYAVETGNLCPDGWHVPTNAEWTALEDYLTNNGHDGTEGTALKTTSGWNNVGNGTDDYDFTALPGGYRNNDHGSFLSIGYYGHWWSSTEYSSMKAWNRMLSFNNGYVYRLDDDKKYGFSVRCIKD
jgi:uncharacterized protein (TIGR02145 family)